MIELDLSSLNFSKGNGYVTIVAQDAITGRVLMVAQADRDAMSKTLETGEMHYASRTRGLWHKGATSGNVQTVVSLHADCDGDAILARVTPAGPACHAGSVSCFGDARPDVIADLSAIIESRAAESRDAPGSYTARLFGDRNLRLKKISEEAGELVVACADGDSRQASEEAADLVYHMVVALRSLGLSHESVLKSLAARAR